MNVTGPLWLTSADQVVNEAVKQTYAFSKLLKEKGLETLLQGGNTIKDSILFNASSTYTHYLPNDTFTWRNPQGIQNVACPWRFSVDHMAWTDQEIELNSPSGVGRDYAKVQYKNLKRIKEQRMWTSIMNGFENDLFASPINNSANMEGAAGALPYSLGSFVTEVPDIGNIYGLRGGTPLGWTTVMGLANTTTGEPRWTNEISYYNPAATDPNALPINATGIENCRDGSTTYTAQIAGLMTAFDDMFLKILFVPPATRQEYFEKAELNRQMILCSRLGINNYKQALRATNDTLVSYQDSAYSSPAYSGVPLMYCSTLDTAALYPTLASGTTQRTTYNQGIAAASTTVGVSETANTTSGQYVLDSGARYYFINGNYLTPVFHANRYFMTHEVMRDMTQPFSWVQPVDCWWNLFANSRQRHGIVCPISGTAT